VDPILAIPWTSPILVVLVHPLHKRPNARRYSARLLLLGVLCESIEAYLGSYWMSMGDYMHTLSVRQRDKIGSQKVTIPCLGRFSGSFRYVDKTLRERDEYIYGIGRLSTKVHLLRIYPDPYAFCIHHCQVSALWLSGGSLGYSLPQRVWHFFHILGYNLFRLGHIRVGWTFVESFVIPYMYLSRSLLGLVDVPKLSLN
jgi:hypothetical protein